MIIDTSGIINKRPLNNSLLTPIKGCSNELSTFDSMIWSVFSAAMGLKWYRNSNIFSRSFNDFQDLDSLGYADAFFNTFTLVLIPIIFYNNHNIVLLNSNLLRSILISFTE